MNKTLPAHKLTPHEIALLANSLYDRKATKKLSKINVYVPHFNNINIPDEKRNEDNVS